jgi:hypothetical protein
MMASIIGSSYRAARTTDSGVPPTPIQVVSVPVSRVGKTRWFVRGARVVPRQVTASCRISATNRSSFSSKRVSY